MRLYNYILSNEFSHLNRKQELLLTLFSYRILNSILTLKDVIKYKKVFEYIFSFWLYFMNKSSFKLVLSFCWGSISLDKSLKIYSYITYYRNIHIRNKKFFLNVDLCICIHTCIPVRTKFRIKIKTDR